ncbi:helix-turn-helix transcriptional regulator [Nocardiopsis algeriensis]|uniref:helix-turn-helix transcriptional regulator n=1 Tax=Nocardiopsis algeriensis TaxID=1478215 RepID=UPI001616EFB2|nr:LuxR family transcriptional regulator [Nocardiopsis algeriensis]
MCVRTCRFWTHCANVWHVTGGTTGPRPVRLRGRDTELQVLTDALAGVRARRGTSLILTGAAGAGKTALLDHAAEEAGDITVLRCTGVADEARTPFAGLQRLLLPLAPHDGVLGKALERGVPGDRLALHTALLDLLIGTGPVLVCVDDADLLDEPSLDALAFVARRVAGTPLAVVLAARGGRGKEGTAGELVPGVEEHVLAPLEDRAVHDILTDHSPTTLDPAVRATLVRASHGNPAAVLGHLSSLDEAELRGRDPLPDPLRLPDRLRESLLAPCRALPERTASLLLLAALCEDPDLHTLVRAGDGVSLEDVEPAEELGLVRISDDTLRFPDPLLREAIVQGAPNARLREAHRRLASVADPDHTPVEFARHTAAGALAPDSALADAVEAAARRAGRLAGRLAASHAHEGAARITPDPGMRSHRLANAAYEAYMAGRSDRALRLLDRARPLSVTERHRAAVELVDTHIAMRGSNTIDAAERLYAVGRALVAHDRHLAVRTLARSADSASLAGDPERHARASALAVSLIRPDDPEQMRLVGDFLRGCEISFRGDYPRSTPLLREAMRLAEYDDPSKLIWAGIAGMRIGETPFVREAVTRAVDNARPRGELATVPAALGFLVMTEFWTGRFPSAAGTALTGLRISRETGQSIWVTHHLAALSMVAAIQGDVDTCRIRARAVATQAGENSIGLAAAVASWALAVLELSRGNAAEAFFRLRSLVHAGPGYGHPTMRLVTAPHFVEAAVRMGETEWARASLSGYRRWAESVGSPSALALASRGSGLLAPPDEAADHFENALALHRSCGDDDVEHARTQLLFGAFLRRARLPGRAREHLHNALETFERFGARLWVRQTRAELRAIGRGEREADSSMISELTAQQQQIARLVAEGATNREVAAHLFISPRTVEHHLRGIFRKLNIRSRVDLARLFN